MVPRGHGRWVFGCGSGLGEGALPLFRLVAADRSIGAVWLVKNEAELDAARALAIPAVLKTSARGFWLTLRAEVIVVTHGFGDANRFATHGGFIVQLWHGIPLKLIQLDSPATMAIGTFRGAGRLRGLLRRAYRRGYQSIGLIPAASERAADRLRTAFGVAAFRVVVTGDARDDVLSGGSDLRTHSRDLLNKTLAHPVLDRTILYAPTWRDGDRDPGAPTADQWQRIDEYLIASATTMILRPHPHGLGDYAHGLLLANVQLLSSGMVSDVNLILSGIDVLVTDYSSIAFDFALTGGAILFLAPDEDAYTAARGLYEPYRDFSAGRAVRSWDGILDQLQRLDSDAEWLNQVRSESAELRDRHFAFTDGHNSERVVEAIRRTIRDRS